MKHRSVAEFGISQPVLRREDRRFVTGAGRYTNDIDLAGQLHAAFARSNYAHAELRRVHTAEAEAMAGVVAVFTGEDLLRGGVGSIHRLPLKGFELGKTLDTARPGLAQGRVRYVGEPVALVVAETANQAADAAARIEMDVEPLPNVMDVEDALKEDAPQIWADAPGNVGVRWSNSDPEKAETIFATAAHVTHLNLRNTRVFANAIEPRASIADYDTDMDRYVWITPSQGVRYMLRVLCDQVFKVPDERDPYPDLRRGRRVRLQGAALPRGCRNSLRRPRTQAAGQMAREPFGKPSVRQSRAGCRHRLRAGARQERTLPCPEGDYPSGHGRVFRLQWAERVNQEYAVGHAARLSHASRACARARRHDEHGADRPLSRRRPRAGRVPGGAAGGQAAREMNIDRVELRRRNMIPASAIPYRNPTGKLYDSGEFEAIMDEAVRRSDWHGFKHARPPRQEERPYPRARDRQFSGMRRGLVAGELADQIRR